MRVEREEEGGGEGGGREGGGVEGKKGKGGGAQGGYRIPFVLMVPYSTGKIQAIVLPGYEDIKAGVRG